jgi:hypothetical protein
MSVQQATGQWWKDAFPTNSVTETATALGAVKLAEVEELSPRPTPALDKSSTRSDGVDESTTAIAVDDLP